MISLAEDKPKGSRKKRFFQKEYEMLSETMIHQITSHASKRLSYQ